MTGKERMLAAILGRPVDRVPIWLREGFYFARPLPDAADFTFGWRAEPDYVELWEYLRERCDTIEGWTCGRHFNRYLGVSPARMSAEETMADRDTWRATTTIDTPKGPLYAVTERRRGIDTTWQIKYPVETIGDLEKLRSAPFEAEPVSYDDYETKREALGERGVMSIFLSSPWVVFSGCAPFQKALEWSATERAMVHEILEENTERALACLRQVFSRPLDTIAMVGGSEQCTPPMMRPEAYAEFVTPYERRMVAFLKERRVPVNCHCHSAVAAALPLMIEAGYDSTDPVEPPPAGDVTMGEARKIVGDRLTLLGDFELDELETATPEHIRQRVREIMDTGKRRLVISASAGPISRMTPKLIANYRAWVEEAMEYGEVG